MARVVRRFAARLALTLVGAGLAVSGIVLLLRAGWIALALPLGPMWASVVLGGCLLLIGALVVFLSARERRRSGLSDSDRIALITNAFLQGLAAGRSAGNGSRGAGE